MPPAAARRADPCCAPDPAEAADARALSRRGFLLRTGGLALTVYGAQGLAGRYAEGIARAAAGGAGAPVLVSIFCAGGADALSLLCPAGDSRYRSLRPTLALAPGSGPPFAEDPRLMWHPNADGLATLHGEGKVSVLPAVGYDHPDQSHFTSRGYWHAGQVGVPSGGAGWLGRLLDRTGAADNPLQGVSLSGSLSPGLTTASAPVSALSKPDDYGFWAPGVWGQVEAKMTAAFGALGAGPADSAALGAARVATANTARLRTQLAPFQPVNGRPAYTSPVTYPTGDDFPARVRSIGAMLAAGLPLRLVTVDADLGWDNHDAEAADFAANVRLLGDTLLAFQRDLEARGLADRVLVLVWSEFGRRPQENGSRGTDHGAAGTALVIGSRAAGRMVGEFPGLATLDAAQNLRATSDFRGMYCSLAEQWLGVDAAGVVPGAAGFARPTLVR